MSLSLSLRCRPPRSPLFPYTTLFRSHTVTEAHEFNFFSLHFFHEASNVLYRADFVKHLKNGFVCTTVSRTPKCRDTSSDTCIRISEEHTSELQSRENLVCRLLLEKKN